MPVRTAVTCLPGQPCHACQGQSEQDSVDSKTSNEQYSLGQSEYDSQGRTKGQYTKILKIESITTQPYLIICTIRRNTAFVYLYVLLVYQYLSQIFSNSY
jgi:hypothetical protein